MIEDWRRDLEQVNRRLAFDLYEAARTILREKLCFTSRRGPLPPL